MRKNILQRSAAFALGAALFLAVLCRASVAALASPHKASTAYGKSSYATSLATVPKTGDAAFDAVAAALTQLGYHEGDSTLEFGGGNGTGSGNFTEYNFANGKIGGTYGYAWCATFASFCLRAAGAGDAAGGSFAGCALWLEHLRASGQFRTRASGYTPKEGDLIFFRSASATRESDHVGLVRAVSGGRVFTVEGNSSNCVTLHDYALSDTYIVGYGLPEYGQHTLSKTHAAADKTAAGYYVVTGDGVSLRAKASAASAKCGTVSRGELLVLNSFENGFGKTVKNGKTVCVSLKYVTFVSPLRFTVSIKDENGKKIDEQNYFSTETPPAAPAAAEKEGFAFAGWQTSSGRLYAAGAVLPSGDLTLTASFTPLKAEEPMAKGEGEENAATGAEESASAAFDIAGEEFSAETATPAKSREKAVRAAGVTSGILALLSFGVTLFLRRREE